MFGISKNAKNKKQNTKDVINANEFLKTDKEDINQDSIETQLSIPSDWKIPNEERYVYAFHNNESPHLKINQVSIYSVELIRLKNNNLVATGLIRNTVQKEIKFGNTTILLLGPNKEPIARKEFDLSRLGNIPANGARPWKFTFSTKEILKDVEIPLSEWSLAFEIKKKHQLDLEASWEKSIAEETKSNLEKIVENANPLKPGEVNFMGIQAKHNDSGELAVTILIRNGSDKNITLQQIPLAVQDATNEEVARGNFKLEDFTVKANTSKPWTFIFPPTMVLTSELDLSKWKVYPIQK